jgi:signal transduction histidine kinase
MIRISQVQRTSTIADFISSRYGKSISMGSIVTMMCFLGIIPYIALQIKAISESFDLLTGGGFSEGKTGIIDNTAFYVLIFMALFTVFFGARKPDTQEKHGGIMAAIAFESVVKLVAMLIAGSVIVFAWFDGFGSLFAQGFEVPAIRNLFVIRANGGFREWFWVSGLSAIAMVVLPRQFQVSVVENVQENHVRKAMWVFPTYLLLINLFVIPVAVAGLLLMPDAGNKADYFLLQIPLLKQVPALALLVFIGGLSAAASMIVVETMALSTMFANNLLLPLLMRWENIHQKISGNILAISLWSRRISIWVILGLAWLYYIQLGQFYSLVSIGLISFVSVAQFAPAMIGGIFWKNGTHAGALVGTLSGFLIWAFTLMLPTLTGDSEWGRNLIENGLIGISWLRPYALFGLEGYDPITHGLFWSMLINVSAYILVSFQTNQSAIEKNQSEVFVNIFQYSAVYEGTAILKGKASLPDLESLLSQFFGPDRSRQVIRLFAKKHQIDISEPGKLVDPRIISYTERLLSGVIGSASARMMVSNIVSEEEIRMDEVVNILKESQQILTSNRELTRKSAELKAALEDLANANLRLQETDQMKDDFLSTVTHELRTPITSIRAFSEILYDNPEIEETERQNYLGIVIKETERLSRLISQVLDLERYDSGNQKLSIEIWPISELINEVLLSLDQLIKDKKIRVELELPKTEMKLPLDRDKVIQVLLNLLSNALKFVENETGIIQIKVSKAAHYLELEVIDNGKGIPKEQQEMIFEKFYQAKNQLLRKPKGSGLGLAICKRILELHGGRISVFSEPGKGSSFTINMPLEMEFIPKESIENT